MNTLFEISYFSMAKFGIAFQGLSRPGILFFKFKDFPGFSRTAEALLK